MNKEFIKPLFRLKFTYIADASSLTTTSYIEYTRLAIKSDLKMKSSCERRLNS